MLHGPCGCNYPDAPCMKDGKCSKKYPKNFRDEILMAEDGYPSYRRRNNGISARKTVSGGREFELRNDTVVPYNPYLSRRFNCHINVEVTTGIHCVKYIYKYVYKGHDRITVTMGALEEPPVRDETREYVDSCYVSPPEAMWRLLSNNMHKHSPPVIRLQVHLPDQQRVLFQHDAALPQVSSKFLR